MRGSLNLPSVLRGTKIQFFLGHIIPEFECFCSLYVCHIVGHFCRRRPTNHGDDERGVATSHREAFFDGKNVKTKRVKQNTGSPYNEIVRVLLRLNSIERTLSDLFFLSPLHFSSPLESINTGSSSNVISIIP